MHHKRGYKASFPSFTSVIDFLNLFGRQRHKLIINIETVKSHVKPQRFRMSSLAGYGGSCL